MSSRTGSKKNRKFVEDWPNIFAPPTGEDTVEYWIFQPNLINGHSTQNPSGGELGEEVTLDHILSFLCHLSESYIWQNQGVRLVKRTEPVRHLFGSTQYDDNLEDEWFVVHLLLELSRKFPQLVIKVNDADGEFLLIEAADHLPKWATPQSTVNRVFLKNGALHLIPLSPAYFTDDSTPERIENPQQAAQIVWENSDSTLASAGIQKSIKRRLEGYGSGDKMRENWHRANCLIPPRVALILEKKPGLVAHAVRCFYLKDPFDLKACREMQFFRPDLPEEPVVLRSVLFTKHLFAMLKQQRFFPDRRSGWAIPPESKDNEKKREAELGMKLTCGFEILCRRYQREQSSDTRHPSFAHKTSSQWEKFRDSLHRNGYFKGELEGSKEYKILEANAKEFLNESLLDDDNSCPPSREIFRILEDAYPNSTAIKEIVTKPTVTFPNDDESWMKVTREDLNKSMDERLKNSGIMPTSNGLTEHSHSDADDEGEDGATKAGASGGKKPKSKDIRRRVEDFIDHGYGPATEGAQLPKRKPKKLEKKREASKPRTEPQGDSMGILDLNIPYCDDDTSSMDSYGEEDLDIDLTDETAKEMKEFGHQMQEYMKQMDEELSGTAVAKDKNFITKKQAPTSFNASASGGDSIDDEDDGFTPVDIDKNLVANMLESYWEGQSGKGGPANTLFSALNIQPPPTLEELDSDDDDDPEAKTPAA